MILPSWGPLLRFRAEPEPNGMRETLAQGKGNDTFGLAGQHFTFRPLRHGLF